MKLAIRNPGMLTTVQDLGRWGHQAIGMPVAGAMDSMALRRGNLIVHNPMDAAALEITVTGPTAEIIGKGLVALAGADLGMTLNGTYAAPWTAHAVRDGDRISFSGMKDGNCRGYLCVSGGIEIPLVMGSRSTYLRAGIGGFKGRTLQKGDTLDCGEPYILWRRCAGFSCPKDLLPRYSADLPLEAVLGPQEDYFTDKGIETFLSEEYHVSTAADRMGYRMDGPIIEHVDGADIVSDAICLGAVQVPGHGQPIVMMADRQTTGGYTKIAVLTQASICLLAQRLPGQPVRFKAVGQNEAIKTAKEEAAKLESLKMDLARWVDAAGRTDGNTSLSKGSFRIRINGKSHDITWEIIE